MSDPLSPDLSRRLESMIRIGRVVAVDPAAARCRVKSGELETEFLPWLERRMGETRDWDPPTIGEQVMVLSPSGEVAGGIVLTGIPSDASPPPIHDANKCQRRYPDGAIVEYDHAGHHALLSVPAGGSIVLTIGATTLTLTDGQAQIDTATLLVKASAKTRFETPILEATGTIQDLCDTSGKTMSGMRAAYNQHRHPENDAGGPTDEPIEKM